MLFFTPTLYLILGQSGSDRKENKVDLTLINEDKELDNIGGFNSASFTIIDILDEDDNDTEEDDLNWYILVICIWLIMVLFMTYYGFLFKCGTIWMVFLT